MNTIPWNDVYTIHVVTRANYAMYEPFLDKANICDPLFLSRSFEELSYSSLEDNPHTIGLFVTDKRNTQLHCSMVLDTGCEKNKDAILGAGYNLNESIEIVLLCANNAIRTPGLTTQFVRFVFDRLLLRINPNAKHVFLYVAKGTDNAHAYSFYTKLGFSALADPHVMVHNLVSQGGKSKQRKKQGKSKNRKRKTTKRRKRATIRRRHVFKY